MLFADVSLLLLFVTFWKNIQCHLAVNITVECYVLRVCKQKTFLLGILKHLAEISSF